MAAARAILPAVAGPVAAEQPTADNDGAGQRQPERHHQSAPLGPSAQLAVLVAQVWVRWITQRRPAWIAAGNPRVAIWPAIPRSPGPAGRAGSRRRRPGAPRAARAAGRPRESCPRLPPATVIAVVGRGGTAASGMPPAWVATGRLRPCGGGPPGWARWSGRRRAPWGAGGSRQLLQFQAEHAVVGASTASRSCSARPRRPTRRGGAAGWSPNRCGRDPAGAAPEQQLDELVEDDPVGDARGRWQPSGWVSWWVGSTAATLNPTGLQDRRWPGSHETSR
jgi:hypothetical protein